MAPRLSVSLEKKSFINNGSPTSHCTLQPKTYAKQISAITAKDMKLRSATNPDIYFRKKAGALPFHLRSKQPSFIPKKRERERTDMSKASGSKATVNSLALYGSPHSEGAEEEPTTIKSNCISK